MPPPRSVHSQALLMLLLANLFWGLSFPLIKALMATHQQLLAVDAPWFITAYTVAPRFLLATVIMVIVLRSKLFSITRLEYKQGALLGLTAGAGLLFQNDGLQFTSASVSAFLTQFYAIMIPLYLALRGQQWPPARVLLCCLLVLAGVGVLGRFDFRAMHLGRGEIETLICSVFFMMQILVLEQKRYSGNRALPVTFVMFAVEAALFLALALGTAPQWSDLLAPWTSPSWLGFTVLLTLVCTVGAYILMTKWQPKISATEAGLIYCVEPVFTSLMALFLPALFSLWAGIDYANETLTWHLLLGGGLITLANILLQLKTAKP